MSGDEMPLTGGRVTVGVVRVGNTVRRPSASNADLVRDLLLHLEQQGFEGTPCFLGKDDRCRDVLTFLEGDVPADLGPFEDTQLAAAAQLLRRFHDATTEVAVRWQCDAEVVCHNDWGPTNTVFRRELPWGLIDFDAAAPGSRLRDLGSSAFLWLDIGNTDHTGREQMRRLAVFAEGYGCKDCGPAEITTAALARQQELARRGALDGNKDLAEWAEAAAAWTIQHMMVD